MAASLLVEETCSDPKSAILVTAVMPGECIFNSPPPAKCSATVPRSIIGTQVADVAEIMHGFGNTPGTLNFHRWSTRDRREFHTRITDIAVMPHHTAIVG